MPLGHKMELTGPSVEGDDLVVLSQSRMPRAGMGTETADLDRDTDSMRRIRLRFGTQDCEYIVGAGIADRLVDEVLELGRDIVLVTDNTVDTLHGASVAGLFADRARLLTICLPPGEGLKSLECLTRVTQTIVAAGFGRDCLVVALGGGVIGNLAGMVAGILFRGVRLIHFPTTTMAAMDSVLSQKQAVNGPTGKNQIGLYHPPSLIGADLRWFATLPGRELRSGLCELAKNTLAIRPGSLSALSHRLAGGGPAEPDFLRWMLIESLAAKLPLLARDPREKNDGLVLEYGHTVGHAIEIVDQRQRGSGGVSHGEAVGIGMMAEARIARALGHLSADAVARHDALLALCGVDRRLPEDLSIDAVLAAMRSDNKRGYLECGTDEIPMVLLQELGRPLGRPDLPLVAVPIGVAAEAIESLRAV